MKDMDSKLEISENSRRVLERRYLKKDANGKIVETPKEMFRRIASNIAMADAKYSKRADLKKTEEDFYSIISSLEFLPNSPTLMNAGKDLQQLSACFVLPVKDSMEAIFQAVKDTSLIHKSGGGCVAKGTKVFSTYCGLENIDVLYESVKKKGIQEKRGSENGYFLDVKKDGIFTLSFNKETGRFQKDRIAKIWHYQLPAECVYKIQTTGGLTVTTSDWHPFFVFHNGRIIEKRADQIKAGDWLIGPNETTQASWPFRKYLKLDEITLNEDVAWLVGFFLGDGSIGPYLKKSRLRFFDGSMDTLERVVKILHGLTGIKYTIQKDTRNRTYYLVSYNKAIINFLRKITGLSGPKYLSIRIPALIYKSPLSVIKAFLAGLIDSDGYVHTGGKLKLTYATASSKMAEDVIAALSLLGFRASIRKRRPRKSKWAFMYEVSIEGREQIGRLWKTLKRFLIGQLKRDRLERFGRPGQHTAKSCPLSFSYIEPYLREIGLRTKSLEIHRRSLRIGNKTFWLARWKERRGVCLDKVLEVIRTILSLNKRLKGNSVRKLMMWQYILPSLQQVTAVKKGAGETDFYDFTVESRNNYLAGNNGLIVVHNTGFSFSRLRPKNSPVRSTGGVASGPVSFMKVFDSATQAVKQGGTRRGANMGILRVDHPDILEFITCKENNKDITNFNISIMVTHDFMNKVKSGENYSLIDPHTKKKAGELNAKEVFELIVKMAHKNGEPGIIFYERLNKDNPTPEAGMFEATNPCVIGDTFVSTEKGLMKIRDLASQYSEGGISIFTDNRALDIMYGGEESGGLAVETKLGISLNTISRAFKTGIKPVLKITTESGYELVATHDHKVMTPNGWIKVEDLKAGEDEVLIQSGSGQFNSDDSLPFNIVNDYTGENGREYKLNLPNKWSKGLGQVLGWLVGDGWLRDEDENCRVGFTFSGEDKEILDYLKPIINDFYGYDIKEVVRENGVYHLSYHSKYFVEFFKSLGVKAWQSGEKEVPNSIYTAPEGAVIGFLQGLFSADGTILCDEKHKMRYVRLTSKSLKLLKEVQLLILNLGIKSRIFNRSRNPRYGFKYINKKGEEKQYLLDGKLYELNISRKSLIIFLEKIGFMNNKHQNLIKKMKDLNYYDDKHEEKVVSIKHLGRREVYDLTEPETLTFISNGFISLDCGEQPLLPYESCNLGSINLSKMISGDEIDWKKLAKTTKTATHFLDNVIDMNKFPLAIIRERTRENRKIGLGVMGFADMLLKLGIPYDSDEALEKAEGVMKFILDNAREASEELAESRGAFPSFEKSIYAGKRERPLRNATLTTIAPTGTLSIIANCSSGIEPIFAVSYIRNVMDNDELVEVHPLFLEIAKERGFYSEELMKKIAKEGGIQNFKEIPDDVKRLFHTSLDISPEYHIKMQSAFQCYTNNAVSKTINFPNNATVDDVRKAYMLAYESGCKGITIYRDKSREEQVLNIGRVKGEDPAGNSAGNPVVQEKPEAADLKPRPRGTVIHGTTTKISTGCGNLYVTINNDEMGQPFEVFMQMGKAGGCAMSQLEAIGRLVSLALRSGVNVDSIVSQLRGIRCPSPSWEKGGGRIFSCSDAIARIIERRIAEKEEAGEKRLDADIRYLDSQLESKDTAGSAETHNSAQSPRSAESAADTGTKTATAAKTKAGSVVGVCPDCGDALRHVEGCQVCNACGYSKC